MNTHSAYVRAREAVVLVLCVVVLLCSLGAVGEGGRERAKRLICLRNLGQLTLAWNLYADDNGGRIVNGATGFSNVNTSWGDHVNELAWVDQFTHGDHSGQLQGIQDGALWSYLADVHIYQCPAEPWGEMLNYAIVFSMNSVLHQHEFSTSVVDNDWRGKHVKRKEEIDHPSRRLVFVDEGWLTSDAYAAHYAWEWWWDLPPVHHNDGATLSFADGHVEYWKWQSPETVAFGHSGDPGARHVPVSCEGFDDLHKVQIGVWGRLGYEPSCAADDGANHE